MWRYQNISEYLAIRKQVAAYFEANPDAKIFIDGWWLSCREYSEESWKQACLDALHNRINVKGDYFDKECQDSENNLKRDVEVVNAWFNGKKKTQWGRNLRSKWMLNRYPRLIQEMREYDRENY